MILNNANTDMTFFYWMSAAPFLALVAYWLVSRVVKLAALEYGNERGPIA